MPIVNLRQRTGSGGEQRQRCRARQFAYFWASTGWLAACSSFSAQHVGASHGFSCWRAPMLRPTLLGSRC